MANTNQKDHDISTVDQEQVAEHESQHQSLPPNTGQDEPPNGGYGWVCVACVALINAHTWGINSSYGVFLAHYLDSNTFPGATYLEFAFIGGLSISMAMLVAPFATIVTRKFGTQACLLVGVFFQTLALLGASWTKEIWQLFLSQGVCFGWGMGFLFVGSVGVASQWFTTRRGLANGIVASGSGLGGLTYSLATNAIIQRLGTGWAFRILGIVSGVVNFTAAITVRDRNKQVGSKHAMFNIKLLQRSEVSLLLGWGFFSMLGYVVLLFSLPNYASYIGLTASQGSIVGAILNLGQALGRPPIGYLSDSFGRINMAATMTFLAGLFSLVIWTNAHSYGVLLFFAIFGGAVAGTYWATIAPVGAEVIGLVDLPTGLSMNWLTLVLPTTFAEPIALEISTRSSSKYLGTQLFAGFMYMAAFMCLIPVRAWKIGQLEKQALEKEISEKSSEDDLNSTTPTEVTDSRQSSLFKRMIMLKRV